MTLSFLHQLPTGRHCSLHYRGTCNLDASAFSGSRYLTEFALIWLVHLWLKGVIKNGPFALQPGDRPERRVLN
jgi:hypothetical protein